MQRRQAVPQLMEADLNVGRGIEVRSQRGPAGADNVSSICLHMPGAAIPWSYAAAKRRKNKANGVSRGKTTR